MTGTRRAFVSLAVGILLLSGCSSGGSEGPSGGEDASAGDAAPAAGESGESEGEDGAAAGSGIAAEKIISTIEDMGLECAEKERHPKVVAQAIECRGEDYLFLTANQFDDPAAGMEYYETVAIPMACGEDLKMDEVRWSIRDDWMLVPGGERDQDVAAHEEASEKLGFEVSAHTCE